MTTTLLYGRPPAVFDPPGSATQVSPLIPGSADLADLSDASADDVIIFAPGGTLERDYVLAQALRVLRPGRRLLALAPKDKGGARLREVGTAARIQIEKLLGTKVYLDLRVKIAKNWQRDPKQLGRLGF